MSEFPAHYPNLHAYVRASKPITYDSVTPAESNLVGAIIALMTPKDILEQTTHDIQVISRELFPTFDALMAQRRSIQRLELVPKRADEVYAKYLKMSRNTFLSIVDDHYLKHSPITLVKELYPLDIPESIGQYVVWIRDENTPDHHVAQFLGGLTEKSGLVVDDIILFERSRKSATNFAKASVTERKHIHMWTRKEIVLPPLRNG